MDLLHKTPVNTVCPNFFLLAHANGCMFSPLCDYCYLKSSLWHLPRPQAFINLARLIDEVRRWIGLSPLECYVLNAGNLSDSMGFERVRPLAGKLIELFRTEAEARGRPHTLLFVTKGGSAECGVLFEQQPCRNVIISFSVNHPEAAARYERGAAPVHDRIATAARLIRLGWRVRIRIDPMIMGYDYRAQAREVRALRPERVTLGSLRAEPNLLKRVNGLFAALEKPADGKSLARYPLRARLALYRQAARALGRSIELGLCEETPDVWRALGLDIEGKTCNCGL